MISLLMSFILNEWTGFVKNKIFAANVLENVNFYLKKNFFANKKPLYMLASEKDLGPSS